MTDDYDGLRQIALLADEAEITPAMKLAGTVVVATAIIDRQKGKDFIASEIAQATYAAMVRAKQQEIGRPGRASDELANVKLADVTWTR